jgi:hypothetical protein
MIKYALKCQSGHEFESWFASAASFEDQAVQGRVACPTCHTADVTKAIMAPALTTHGRGEHENPAGAGEAGIALVDKKQRGIFAEVRAFRDYILGLTEDVGARFPEEARKIAEGAVEDRPIRGHARIDEAKELLDEGICVLPIPFLPEDFN